MDFSALLDDSLAALAGLPRSEIALPEAYAQAARPEKQGTLRLSNRFFRIGDFGELRAVLIAAPKIHIINLFLFPAPHRDVPLYAMNFVVLGPKPLAAVIDAVCLAEGMPAAGPLATRWGAARARYGHLPQAEDMPDWYRACRSGHDFFVRPKDGQALAELADAHRHLWREFLLALPAAGLLNSGLTVQHAACITDYKHHHRANSPGVPLLQRSFGREWTEHYLARILFE